MTVVIDKNTSPEKIKKLLEKVSPKLKTVNTTKYLGKIKWKGDPLKIQRQLRDE